MKKVIGDEVPDDLEEAIQALADGDPYNTVRWGSDITRAGLRGRSQPAWSGRPK